MMAWIKHVKDWIKSVFGDAGSAGESIPATARDTDNGFIEKDHGIIEGVVVLREKDYGYIDGGGGAKQGYALRAGWGGSPSKGGHRDYRKGKNSEVIDGGTHEGWGGMWAFGIRTGGWPLVPWKDIFAKGFGWGKPIVASVCLVLLLSACTLPQIFKNVGAAETVIKDYTRGQITYKQEHRVLVRRTVEEGQVILMDHAQLLVRQGKHDEGIKVIEDTLKFLQRNTPLLGQILLDKDLLELKRTRLDKQIKKLKPKKKE